MMTLLLCLAFCGGVMCGFLAFETNKKLLEKSDKELAEYQRLKAKFEGK